MENKIDYKRFNMPFMVELSGNILMDFILDFTRKYPLLNADKISLHDTHIFIQKWMRKHYPITESDLIDQDELEKDFEKEKERENEQI